MPRISYVNGRYLPHSMASIHPEDRGFLFADSVYEVIAVINGKLADEEGHLDRLYRSMSELGIPAPLRRATLQSTMRELIRRNKTRGGGLYIQVTRGVSPRDFKFPNPSSCTPGLFMMIRDADFDIGRRRAVSKSAVTVPDIRWKRRDIKSTALLAQVLAKQSAVEQGGYEAFMVDEDGFVTEGASSNAWIVKGHTLITRSSAHNAILKGITRTAILSLLDEMGMTLDERAFTPEESYQADECFTSSAVALIVPIVKIDGHVIGQGKPGNVTLKILETYFDYAAGKHGAQRHWSAT